MNLVEIPPSNVFQMETIKIVIGDNANYKSTPLGAAYYCVEEAMLSDIARFQIPLLNKYQPLKDRLEIHLSAGHCDIVRATLKAHGRSHKYAHRVDSVFDVQMNTIAQEFKELCIKVKQLCSVLYVYELRNPEEFRPSCASLKPLAPQYELGVRQLNGCLRNWDGQELIKLLKR